VRGLLERHVYRTTRLKNTGGSHIRDTHGAPCWAHTGTTRITQKNLTTIPQHTLTHDHTTTETAADSTAAAPENRSRPHASRGRLYIIQVQKHRGSRDTHGTHTNRSTGCRVCRVNTRGGDAVQYAWHAETRAEPEGCIDRTVYGTSRTATTSFFTHHLRLISLAAVIGAALPVAIWAKSRKSHLLSGAPLAGLLPVDM
jgi:hypothetical protein